MFTRFTVLFRLVFVVAALAIPLSAMSQSFYGSLVAVVEDPQGGVMPGASIVLVNTATSERREGVSAEDGTYRFVNLVPGTYRLEVELTGFQRYVRDQIQVSVQTTPRIAVTLQLGSLQETISVSGEAPQLQTEGGSVGTIVGTRAVQELPLNGRNVLNLITVAPTVVPQGGSEGSLTGKNVFAAGNYQIGGGVANQSATLYDGVPLQDTAYGNIVVLTPSPEAVEEFRVQTNNSSAEFGRFTGGVINMASRSGTNAFRGSAFEYFRNKALNSNTFFGERAGLDKPPFTQNNFGGVLGGPVMKNKLFFFSSYEGYRNREGVLFRRTVPTAAMKAGDFSDYRNLTTGAVVPIYDPWTQCGIVNPGTGVANAACGAGVPNRQQFPGNIIPANRISAIAKNFLNWPIYAEPTVAGRWTTNNFEKNASIGGDNDQYNIRGDYNVAWPTAEFAGMNRLTGVASGTKVLLDSGVEVRVADPAQGPVAVLVAPWEVSLSPAVPEGLSSLNHLEVTVRRVVPLGNRVRVALDGLTAEVTPESAARLELRPGVTVVASWKATASRTVPRA